MKPIYKFSCVSCLKELIEKYPQDATEQIWLDNPNSDLLVPRKAPRFLFRGEPGQFPTTTPAAGRLGSWEFHDNSDTRVRLGRVECASFQELSTRLLQRFTGPDYNLSPFEALAVLQHYGLPTVMIDFTANPGTAMVFAINGGSHKFGRICVLTTESFKRGLTIAELGEHQWAVRACRQEAFGICRPNDPKLDLKSAPPNWGVQWYEFPITDQDRDQAAEKYTALISTNDDPTAGILLHELIEDVERNGKLPPNLAKWLVHRPIPMVPRAYRVVSEDEGLVEHLPPSHVGGFDEVRERVQTERYLSQAYQDKSQDRLHYEKLEVGKIIVDPRTLHQDGPQASSA